MYRKPTTGPRLADLLSNIADTSVSAHDRVAYIDVLLTTVKNDHLLEPVARTAVEDVIHDIHKELVRSADSMYDLHFVCLFHSIKLAPFVHAKQISYQDSESVHIFNDDTIQCVDWLLREYKPRPFVRPFAHEFFDFLDSYTEPVHAGKSLKEILQHVMDYVEQSPHRNELLTIMKQEFEESTDKCVTGRLAAIVSCLYGFPGVPDMTGNEFEHEKSTVFHFLNNHLDLFDVAGLVSSIIRVFDEGILPITKNTARILQAYTLNNWVTVNDHVYVAGN